MQALAFKKEGVVSKQMLKYVEGISKESWVEVQGTVQIPMEPKHGKRLPITGASQQVAPAPAPTKVHTYRYPPLCM
jgi:hypothetical protein